MASSGTADSPYKFLDSYREDDHERFFGRNRETEMLLSDVVISRLVVLFAKTGTGKTSLINASVRPALHRRGYETFFVRVRRDPAASAREELLRHPQISALEGATLAEELANAVTSLEPPRPIVVFFDQFEEFFLYLAREEPDAARAFVSDLAELYRNRESAVHVVLSMREDFYVELDSFRDDIPTIFQRESNLRLRWFEREQARAAIVGPLEAERTAIEPELVERLLDDLSRRHGLVEPAQLQIVCDTLWRESEDGVLTLDEYVGLGHEEGASTIAEQIVSSRLAEQFENFDTREELQLVEWLLTPGILSTDRGTKYVRDLPSLMKELGDAASRLGGEDGLRDVLEALEQSRLVRMYVRDELDHIELMHDYLVAEPERLAELRRSVRAIWPRRVVAQGRASWDPARRAFVGTTTELEEVLDRVAAEHEQSARDGEPSADHLRLAADDALVLLRLALHRGICLTPAYEVALAHGVPAWETVLETIEGPNVDDATYAVALLGELGTQEAVEALAEALDDERIAAEAQSALTTIAASPKDATCAAIATNALVAYLEGTLANAEMAPLALEDLGRLQSERSVDVLERALTDRELADSARSALRRLARSPKPDVAERAHSVLGSGIKPPLASPPAPVPEPRFETPALKRRVATSESIVDESHFSVVAKALLEGRVLIFLGPGANLAGRPPDAHWSKGGYLPIGRELADDLSRRLTLGDEWRSLPDAVLEANLLLGEGWTHDYLHDVFDADYPPNPLHRFVAGVPAIVRGQTTDPQLVVTTLFDDTLERAFDEAGETYDLVYYLADGENRGRFAHRSPDEEVRIIANPLEYIDVLQESRSVILKLFGTIDRSSGGEGDSFLVQADDFADFDLSNLPPLVGSRLVRSHVLYLGYSIRDWAQRVVVRRAFGRPTFRSWAVMRLADAVDVELWRERSVEVVTSDLDEYVTHLSDGLGRYREAYA
jgi:hypothetical protein